MPVTKVYAVNRLKLVKKKIFDIYKKSVLALLVPGLFYIMFSSCWLMKRSSYKNTFLKSNYPIFLNLEEDLNKAFQLTFKVNNPSLVKHKENISFNLIRNFEFIQKHGGAFSGSGTMFTYDRQILKITNREATTLIDLKQVEDTIAAFMPDFIRYKVLLNNRPIISSPDYEEDSCYENLEETHLLPKILLTTKIALSKKFLLKQKYNLLFTCAVFYFSVLAAGIFVFSILLKTGAFRPAGQLDALEEALESSHRQLKLLENKRINELNLNKMITRRIHELAKKSAIKDLKAHGNIRDEFIKNNLYLLELPLTFVDRDKVIINLKDCFNYITEFFQYDLKNKQITLETNINAEIAEINTSKALFYQLMISLIDNMLRLLPEMAKLHIEVSGTKEQPLLIIIKHCEFFLSEQQMLKFTDYPIEKLGNIYILNMKQIFSGLQIHGFSYKIEKNFPQGNIITIYQAASKNLAEDEVKNNVINLLDYLRQEQ